MRYIGAESSVRDVLSHLRNTTMAVLPLRANLSWRLLARARRILSRLEADCLDRMGLRLVVSERIIENALILQSLRKDDEKVLDFGGFESVLPLQLASLGHQVTVLDQRRYPFLHPNLTAISADLFQPGLPVDGQFDVVVSVSTIEHLGLGAYGDKPGEGGDDVRGVEILWSLVKRGGRLIASVPAGKGGSFKDFRVYDAKGLRQVFPSVTQVRHFMKDGREGVWREVDGASLEGLTYRDPAAAFPVEAVAFVICEKT